MLQQVRDQTLPGSGLTFGCNTLRGNNVWSCYYEVNNQNLPGFNLTQSNINDVFDDPNYQSMYFGDQVRNSYSWIGSHFLGRSGRV